MKTQTRTKIVLLIVLLSISLLVAQDGLSSRIIPTPQIVRPGVGQFRFSSSSKIVIGSNEDRSAADRLNDALEQEGRGRLKIVEERGVRKISSGGIYIGSPKQTYARKLLSQRPRMLTPVMAEEGYLLEVSPDGVVIIGESARGRFYGVMSLLQLLSEEKRTLTAPSVVIKDWPLQKIRGITDDISRGQVSTVENFKTIIRFCARHKLNVYSPYLEDMFVFKNHPLIGKGRGALTVGEVKELDAYAQRYHVEMIPIFETLGHWENILKLSEYVQFAEYPGAHTLNISDERVYTMLDEMIGELADAFHSPFFNMAADESWDVGRGANKARVEASDLATVHAEHYKRLFEILKKHGKKPMMYGDIILNNPGILEKIPKNVVIVDWHYGAADAYPSPAVFRTAGFPYVVSPAVWNHVGPFPNYSNAFVNIRNLNRDGYRNGSLGLLTSNWNDHGGECLRELNYLAYAWTAECAWQPERAEVGGFDTRFFQQFFGSTEAAIAASSVYAILSDAANQMSWFDLWRHPMLPPRTNPLPVVWRIQTLESTMPTVQKLIEVGGNASDRNRGHWAVLRYVMHINRWYGLKLKYGEVIRGATSPPNSQSITDSLRNQYRTMIARVVSELDSVSHEFAEIWNSTNRPDGLPFILLRHDRQKQYWLEKEIELDAGNLWVEPAISSQWIYHPTGNPGTKDSTNSQVRLAYFSKALSIPRVLSARIQVLADTRARLWVNGRLAGEVLARRSLSLSLEYERSKIFDIAPLLVDGENTLSLEAENYLPNSSAGINVVGTAVFLDSTSTEFQSDSSWLVSAITPDAWPQKGVSVEKGGMQAKSAVYSVAVIRPNLLTGRTSWFER